MSFVHHPLASRHIRVHTFLHHRHHDVIFTSPATFHWNDIKTESEKLKIMKKPDKQTNIEQYLLSISKKLRPVIYTRLPKPRFSTSSGPQWFSIGGLIQSKISALLTLFTKINVQIKKCGYIGDLPCKHCSMLGGNTSHHPKLHLLIRRELNSFNVLVLFVLCF